MTVSSPAKHNTVIDISCSHGVTSDLCLGELKFKLLKFLGVNHVTMRIYVGGINIQCIAIKQQREDVDSSKYADINMVPFFNPHEEQSTNRIWMIIEGKRLRNFDPSRGSRK